MASQFYLRMPLYRADHQGTSMPRIDVVARHTGEHRKKRAMNNRAKLTSRICDLEDGVNKAIRALAQAPIQTSESMEALEALGIAMAQHNRIDAIQDRPRPAAKRWNLFGD
jgi:hypothetical protein